MALSQNLGNLWSNSKTGFDLSQQLLSLFGSVGRIQGSH